MTLDKAGATTMPMRIDIKRSVWKTVAGLVAFSVLAATGCAPTGPRALLEGQKLIQAGKYDQAVAMLLRATATLPQNAQAWNHLGLAYHGGRHYDQARAAYHRALTLDRNLMAARYNLGCLLLDEGDPAGAIPQFTSVCVMQRDSPEGWLKLGLAEMGVRQYVQAATCFTNTLRLRPHNPEAWNQLGLLQSQRNRPRESLVCFATALQQQWNYGPALLNQAILYQQTFRNRSLALQKYREYLALKPTPANVAGVEAIVRELERELQPPPRPVLSNELAQFVVASNRPALHSNSVLKLAQAGDRRVPALTATSAPAHTASMKGPSPASLPGSSNLTFHASNQVANPPAPAPPVRTTTGAVAQATHPVSPAPKAEVPKPKPLAVVTREAAHLPPEPQIKSPTTEIGPPPARATSPEPPKAATPPPEPRAPLTPAPSPANIALASVPANAPGKVSPAEKRSLWARLNPVSWFRGRPKAIITPLPPLAADAEPPIATSTGPGTSVPPTNTVVAPAPAPAPKSPRLTALTPVVPRAVSARYPYRSPPKPAPGDRQTANKYFQRGVEAQADRQWTLAEESYQQAIAADPSYGDARYNLALADYRSGRLAQALLQYEYALAIDPTSFNARYNFALALDKANYPRDAANELEKLVQQVPSDPRLHLMLGNLYAQQLFQPQLARQHYERLLELDPRNPQAATIRYWLAANP